MNEGSNKNENSSKSNSNNYLKSMVGIFHVKLIFNHPEFA